MHPSRSILVGDTRHQSGVWEQDPGGDTGFRVAGVDVGNEEGMVVHETHEVEHVRAGKRTTDPALSGPAMSMNTGWTVKPRGDSWGG